MTRRTGAPGEPKEIKINVVDRRHHAAAEGDAASADAARSPYPAFVEELRARTEVAERRAKEAVARVEEELDAVRERLTGDIERRVMQGKLGFLGAVLGVLDNLERAAKVAAATAPALEEGIALIHQQLLGVLKAQGVEMIETLGQPYDPHVAEAVMTEPVEPSRDGLVIEEIERGFRLGETILRPARVKVGRAAPASS
ncbi:MAG TPA: nucleotide exchange factor GrpE [Candidatus Polarisedimenticolia bacterium]|nr:nucleotide exchange factor GrpE [Candidatus Polarisedimenticolia bacterium]